MKFITQHETLGELCYEENILSGKRKVIINGQELLKCTKNTFFYTDNSTITVKGNMLTGVKFIINDETITVVSGLKWYEYVLSILPFLLVVIWGNSVALCKIVPIIGGAIGGLISGIHVAFNLYFMRKLNNLLYKILVSIAVLAICFGICYLVALLFINFIL